MITIDTTPLPNKRIKDIRGQRFARLVVLAYAGRNKNGGALWRCACDCGKETLSYGTHLLHGNTKSCGCLNQEAVAKGLHATHRMRNTPEYRAWGHIKTRCTNPRTPDYPNYGGRGIVMCERWINSFENFYADMGPKPSPAHTIERIDNDGPYAPENCKWADRITQANNKCNNHLITYQGVTQTIPEWARELGMDTNTLKRRILRGMTPETAFTQEVRPIKYKSLTYGGETMTVSQWAKKLGVSGQVITHRLYQGWSVEDALTLPLSARRQQG